MKMTHEFIQAAGREIHFTQWGHEHRDAVVLWHGLVRTGRDFDALAGHLAARYRVLCPDTLGRGLSQWAVDKSQEYTYPFYGKIVAELLERLNLRTVRWLGTSMGGLLGIYLASGPLKGRITQLLLNDIGPDVPAPALKRIFDYVGHPREFDTLAGYEQWLRQIYATFGALTDATWRHLAVTSHRRTDDGRVTVHYDPQVLQGFTSGAGQADLWAAYDAVPCPTLVIRGAASDVLAAGTAEEMTRRGPRAALRLVADCGHAPLLDVPDQMALVTGFFNG
ncbi:MAG: alpha/beta fold hydrolase [SAR324 cluster bacterium]